MVASGNGAVPGALLSEVDQALESYRLFMLNAPVGIPSRPGVVHETVFVGPGMRHSAALAYFPARLSLVPTLFARTLVPDLLCLNVSRPVAGRYSLGTEVNILPAAIEACRGAGGLVLGQVNRRMPWTYGDGLLDEDDFDALIDADEDLAGPAGTSPDEDSGIIGELVAARIPDGATLQMGIGAVPDAVLPGLRAKRDLRVWSEMFSDGVLALHQAGVLDDVAVITGSFALGSAELLEWLHRNPRVEMRRTDVVNSPSNIAAQPLMTSINTALQVDLFGQANASRINARIYSGFGGQTDFIVGALHAAGGQALMALRSWHPKADASAVVALVDEPVTSFQHTAVITEQGVAEIFGQPERMQAAELIEHAAHPRVREELREEAIALGLLA